MTRPDRDGGEGLEAFLLGLPLLLLLYFIVRGTWEVLT